MALSDIIRPDAVVSSLRANAKKTVLLELSERAGMLSGLPARTIYDTLIQREALGSTGIGEGIAIPHGKLARCEKLFGIFARLERPVAFDAFDDVPVDLIFLLIAPENAGADHLSALSRVARTLRDPAVARALRSARDPFALYAVLAGMAKPDAA